MADPFAGSTWGEISSIETHENTGLTVRQELRVLWANRYTVKIALLTANYGMGMLYPHVTPAAYCKEVTISPVMAKNTADGDGYATYEYVKLVATYRSPSFVDPETVVVDGLNINVTEEFFPAIEAIAMPIENLEWASDSEPISEAEAPIKQLYDVDYIQVHRGIPESAIPGTYGILTDVLAIVGMVNIASVVTHLLKFTFLAEQLLCKPPVIRRASEGIIDIEYRFKGKFPNWNTFWRNDILNTSVSPNTWGDWDTMRKSGESEDYKNFPLGDFSSITG